MKLQIRLLSDMCASSGETFNSYVDTDVVYDDYGLPYIPAKRIKGCIREAALELEEWGLFKEGLYEALFGKEGNEKSRFSLDNAYLKDYEKLVSDLENCQDKALVHPQRVLSLYTYTRTQTAMTRDGVADKGSLRTMRVINKGLVFEAYIRENVRLTDEQRALLESAVSMVKHMGSGRTRGLGLVEFTLVKEEKTEEKKRFAYELGERNKISYTITLRSPLLCKSASGSQEKTHDYIEGSKVLGLLAQNMSSESFSELMHYDGSGQGIIVSNAYICEGGKRCTPMRASLQKKKDQTYDASGELRVKDMLVPCREDAQWTPVGHGYMNEQGYTKSVDLEVNYHHRRPNNKAVGKANGEDGSAFYQFESIRKGQQFSGYIMADQEQAASILEVLSRVDGARMGYGRNAEYGNVDIEVTEVEAVNRVATQMTDSFVVKLNAAIILYNAYGMPCAEVECLKSYLAEALQVEESMLHIDSAFLTYETIGGFNVTWKRRKPIFVALGKGTVCRITADREVDIAVLQSAFLGERVAEGYGEVEVSVSPKAEVVLKKAGIQKAVTEALAESDILLRLQILKEQEELSRLGVKGANELLKNEKALFGKNEFKAALGKLILIVKSEYTLKSIKEQVGGIESNAKREICDKLLKKVEKDLSGVSVSVKADEVARIYLYNFLNQLKYVTYKKGGTMNE